jgi:pyruvate/2-oxoglutarate dehydrogenase complex dihydrolipoamide dehydrogenase (E3) component
VDEHTVGLGDGQRLQAEKFILCTGGHARRLDFPGAEYAMTHSDVWSLKARPQSLIVVGAAATGCQIASIFSAFGTQVWLMERAERILRVEDPLVSETVGRSFENHGIQLITGIAGIESIQKNDRDLRLTYQLEGATYLLEAEAVILSSGWLGNVEPLNLQAAGVKHERNYILVDDYLRTSTPHIFAAGDVTGRMMLVQSAGYEALYAAENAVLGVGQPNRHLIVPHGGFTDPEYASVGMTEEKAQASGQEYLTVVVPYANMDRAVIDGRTEGFCKLIVSQENHRILGASVAGEGAVEIVHVVAAGMAADIWVEQLAELELAYPTFSAIIGLAAREAVYQLGVTPLAHQWRTLGKRRAAEWERDNYS